MGRLDLPDPVRDEDIFVENALAAGGHLADDVAFVVVDELVHVKTETLAAVLDPVRDEDIFVESALAAGGHLADDVAAVVVESSWDEACRVRAQADLVTTLVSDDPALD